MNINPDSMYIYLDSLLAKYIIYTINLLPTYIVEIWAL